MGELNTKRQDRIINNLGGDSSSIKSNLESERWDLIEELSLSGGSGEGLNTYDATATANDIAKDKTAYVKGVKVTGNVPVVASELGRSASSMTNVSTDYLKAYKVQSSRLNSKFLLDNSSNIAITVQSDMIANTVGLTADKVKAGETILEVEGTYTSDADATAKDIAQGKTAYVNGEKVTGTSTAVAVEGNIEITENGEYDVSSYETATIIVPTEGGGTTTSTLKIFNTYNDMIANNTPVEGEYVAIYWHENAEISPNCILKKVTVPARVTLPEALPEDASIRGKFICDLDETIGWDYYLDAWSFTFNDANAYMEVDPEDSKTYVDVFNTEEQTFTWFENGKQASYIYDETTSTWHDYLKYFIKIESPHFDSVYQYKDGKYNRVMY